MIFAYNFLYSLVAGPKAPTNPWHANTLEWATSSPPAHYNFERIPVVYHAPYEFSVPGVEEDYLPQTQPRPAMCRSARSRDGVTWNRCAGSVPL